MVYVKKKDRLKIKEYNSYVSSRVNPGFYEFVEIERKKKARGFLRRNKYGNRIIICGECHESSEPINPKLKGVGDSYKCPCCGLKLTLLRASRYEWSDWLAYVEKCEYNEKIAVARYFYFKYSETDSNIEIYEDEIKHEFFDLETGDSYECYKGFRPFYSTIRYSKRDYFEWCPTSENEYFAKVTALFWKNVPEFDGQFKYCALKETTENDWPTRFIRHMQFYQRNQELEKIVKIGYENGYYRFEDLNRYGLLKDIKTILKCKKLGLTGYNDAWMINYDFTAEEADVLHRNLYHDHLFKKGLNKYQILKAINKGYHMSIWEDYLDALTKLNIVWTKDAIYPKNLDEAHNRLMARIQAKENKKYAAEIKKLSETLEFDFKDKELEIVLPKSAKDIIREGEMQHNCVGKMGYIKKMAEHKCIILFVRKKTDLTKSYITVELDFERKQMRQAYFARNQNIPPELYSKLQKGLLVRQEERRL